MSIRKIRLILGDQLNRQHSWFSSVEDDVLYVLMEIRSETDYARHHIQKVAGIFAAMRAFHKELVDAGHICHYFTLADDNNAQDIHGNIKALLNEHSEAGFEYIEPDEYRLEGVLEALTQWVESQNRPVTRCDAEHFLCKREEFVAVFKDKKTYLMESFYRYMRKKHDILMRGDQPEGGQWNYDAKNRKSWPAEHRPPEPLVFDHDVTDLVDALSMSGVETIGEIDPKHFAWPIDRKEALELLEYFTHHLLHRFGTFQDAMTPEGWSLYHSRLSFAINLKILHPKEVIDAVIDYWQEHKDDVELSQVEGFVRQILGWREYMRGVYWSQMPEYADTNHFNHTRSLPEWYWTGDTKMACLRHSIKQSLQFAYAHHIQRLMVTGNFALLAGVDPDEVDAWYLGIYIDAFEWVEITNTRGMSQYADGGIVGSKPYVSSANYIDKMSTYCSGCYYSAKEKTGAKSCPFNSLHWHFYERNRETLQNEPRVGMMYRTWDKMAPDKRSAILDRAEEVLQTINQL